MPSSVVSAYLVNELRDVSLGTFSTSILVLNGLEHCNQTLREELLYNSQKKLLLIWKMFQEKHLCKKGV